MAQIPPQRSSTATSMSSPPPSPSPLSPLFPRGEGTPPPLPNRSRLIPLAAATLPLRCHPTTALLGERYIEGSLLEYLASSLDGDSAVAAVANGDGGVDAPPPHDDDDRDEERESPEDDASKRQPPRGSGLPSELSGGGNLDERPRLRPRLPPGADAPPPSAKSKVNLDAGGRGQPRWEEEEGVPAAGGEGDAVVVATGPLEKAKEGDGDDVGDDDGGGGTSSS
jgi:hypothetical protein